VISLLAAPVAGWEGWTVWADSKWIFQEYLISSYYPLVLHTYTLSLIIITTTPALILIIIQIDNMSKNGMAM
jgi:hypothetical protein